MVVNFYSDSPYVVGTATVLCGQLLVTAKHVFDDIWDEGPSINKPTVHLGKHLVAVQIVPGPEPEYLIWDVVGGWICPWSDIALLHLSANPARSAHHDTSHQWKQPRVNPFAPAVGERVAAFGYHSSTVKVSRNADGSNHVALDDEPTMSVGIVKEIYEFQRDSNLLPFPCYQVSARFDGGMSGGPVYDETGCLCGIVCTNFAGSHLDGDSVSYVTTLWPMFQMIINAGRGNNYPRDVHYPVMELARGGQISVPDLSRLELSLAEHVGPVQPE